MATPEGIFYLADRQLEIDTEAHRTHLGGELLELPPKEQDLLEQHALHPDQIQSAAHLTEELWGVDNASTRACLHVCMRSLRRRLDDFGLGSHVDGVLRTRYKIGSVGVSTLVGDEYLWQPDHQRIITPSFQGVALNESSYALRVDVDKPQPLRRAQFRLFYYLFLNEGIVLSEGQLFAELESPANPLFSNVVPVAINTARRLLGPVYGDRDKGVIRTVREFGYKFTKPEGLSTAG